MNTHGSNKLKKTIALATLAIMMVAAGCTKSESQADVAAKLQRDWNARIEEMLARGPKDSAWREDAKTAIAQLGELDGGAAEWSQIGATRLEDALVSSLEAEIAALEDRKAGLESKQEQLSSQLLGVQVEIMDCARESQELSMQVQATEEFTEQLHAIEDILTLLSFFTGQNPEPDPELEAKILNYSAEHLETSQGIDRRVAEVGEKLARMAGPWNETVTQLESCTKALFDLQLELIELQRARREKPAS